MASYSKLEVKGEWKSNSDGPTEVLVAFGSISLNILNTNGEPVRQWAYSSIFLKNKEASKSMFCPDLEETESLYIFDQDAVNHLIFLSNKTNRKKFANLLPWFFIIILLISSFTFFSSYFRIVIEKIALSITSAEQESNLGNIMLKEMSEVSYCNINKTNEYLRSLEKNYVSITDDSIELIFMNFMTMNSILLPGRKLLVPYSILENEDGAFVLAKTTKLALAALKNKKAIEEFFSKQRSTALLIYIFGNFTDLNFYRDKGLLISLDSASYVFDEGFTDKEWLKLKSICKL
mgnify:CR=1 FL=1